jgi:membrane protein YdbS with pleckstrin-like domain
MAEKLTEVHSDVILSANGRPFTDLEAAEQKAVILAEELGYPYIVIDHPLGGYGVTRKIPRRPERVAPLVDSFPPMNSLKLSVVSSESKDTKPNVTRDFVLRPAWRSFWRHSLLIFSGVSLAVAPRYLLYSAAAYLFNADPYYLDLRIGPEILSLIASIGVFMALVGVIHMTVLRLTCKYTIDSSGIETDVGILSRQTQRIVFQHVRSVNVRQSIMDRILNIGMVEFSSAASDGGDLIFRSIQNPRALQEEVYRRMKKSRSQREDE